MAAVILSTTALAVLSLLGERPSLPELISWLDMETLLLLFSMMLLVAIMAETGLFDYLAVYTFEVRLPSHDDELTNDKCAGRISPGNLEELICHIHSS